MRLISQHGNVDVPYDNVSLIHKGSEIVAITCHETPNGVYEFTMGKYSTNEKAYKVMEMVREDYLKIMRIENGSSIQGLYDIPKVFIFPKDEDVEV